MSLRFLLAAMLFATALSGCIGGTAQSLEAQTLVVRYTLFSESDEGGGADPGPHCTRAIVHANKVRVAQPDLDKIGDVRPLLVIDPKLEGSWATSGYSGFANALPYTIDPAILGDDTTLGKIGWNAKDGGAGVATLNGKEVNVPHTWTITAKDKSWRAELTLEKGPDLVEGFDPGLCA